MKIKLDHRARNLEFRPIYRPKQQKAGDGRLLLRFARRYLWPYRRALLVCALLAALDACGSFYLIAWYSRVVVDKILVVRPAAAAAGGAVSYHEPAPKIGGVGRREVRAGLEQTGLQARIEKAALDTGRPPRAGRLLFGLFVLYFATIVVGNLINRLATQQRITIGTRITGDLRGDMHAHVLRLTVSAQSVHTPGRLMARILSDVEAVQDYMLTIIINGSSQVLMVVTGLLLLFSIEWRIALLVLLMMPIYIVIYRKAQPAITRCNHELRHTNACLYGLVSQKLDAIRLIQSANRAKRELLTFHRLVACYLRDAMHQSWLSSLTGRLSEVVSAVGTNGVVFLFGMRQVLSGAITLGQMLYAYGTTASLFAPVLALSRMNVVVSQLLVSLRRLADLMDEPAAISDHPEARPLAVPLRRGLEVRRLAFAYLPQQPVLRGVDLRVPAGEWLCVMGPSGAGKTTLLYLLARLLESKTGEILYDGMPVEKIQLASLRRHVVLVPQEPQILSGTVRDNICYGRPYASPAEIMDAARAAEFHDFVMSLPVQYETILGEKGTSLSGGQRQRLSLARALLTKPEVLLLDDCTSALDAETEYRIQQTLQRVLQGKTAVIVSQRVSMARRCHKIGVLQNGQISEYGAPDELRRKNGYYARLEIQQTSR